MRYSVSVYNSGVLKSNGIIKFFDMPARYQQAQIVAALEKLGWLSIWSIDLFATRHSLSDKSGAYLALCVEWKQGYPSLSEAVELIDASIRSLQPKYADAEVAALATRAGAAGKE